LTCIAEESSALVYESQEMHKTPVLCWWKGWYIPANWFCFFHSIIIDLPNIPHFILARVQKVKHPGGWPLLLFHLIGEETKF